MTKQTTNEIIIGVLAIISIILLAIESLLNVTEGTLTRIYVADLIICIVFARDFISRLISNPNKHRFLKTNGFEILAMIPALLLSALGGIPLLSLGLRSLRLVRVIRVFLLLARMRRLLSNFGKFASKSHLITMLVITFCIILMGAFAVLILEKGAPTAQITSLTDAIWWSISTVTTVGYGDIVPMSIVGRIMGMLLMIVGIGVMAAFISQVSATLVESKMRHNEHTDDLKTLITNDIKNKLDNIDKLNDNEVYLLIETIKALRTKGGAL